MQKGEMHGSPSMCFAFSAVVKGMKFFDGL